MSTRLLSNMIKFCFLIFIAFSIVWMAGEWFFYPEKIGLAYGFFLEFTPKYEILYEMGVWKRLGGFLITFAFGSFGLIIFWLLYKLFDCFSKGEFFSLHVVTLIKWAGLLYLIKEVLAPVYEVLISFFLTYANPSGHRVITVSFQLENFEQILLGIILFVAARIMAEGLKLKQETQLTV